MNARGGCRWGRQTCAFTHRAVKARTGTVEQHGASSINSTHVHEIAFTVRTETVEQHAASILNSTHIHEVVLTVRTEEQAHREQAALTDVLADVQYVRTAHTHNEPSLYVRA